MRFALDLVKRGVSCSDHADGAGCHTRAVPGREPAALTQGFEGADDVRECCGAIGLDVNEEVQGLRAIGVVDAVLGWTFGEERRAGVLSLEDGEDGLDI